MKQFKTILAGLLLVTATACSSTYHAGSNNDDVYYSSKDRDYSQPATTSAAAPSDYTQAQPNDVQTYDNNQSTGFNDNGTSDYYSQERTADGEGNGTVNNYYFNDDDYYDYAYSTSLRRFYSPAYGYNYYDPYYTNLYWYDYNPVNWGVSIYFGYNWWAPSTWYSSPFCYGGYSPWYHPYNSWYNPYYSGYNPYYGYGYGYNNYWNGYNQGYWNGYNDGYWNNGYYGYYQPYYYNTYESTSYYYGPRGNVASNSDAVGTRPPRTLANVYDPDALGGKVRPTTGLSGTNNSNSTINVRPVKDQTGIGSGKSSDKSLNGNGSKPAISGTVQDDRGGKNNTSKPTLGTKPAETIKDNNTNAGRPNYTTAPKDGSKPVNDQPVKPSLSNGQQQGSPFERPKSVFEKPQQNSGSGVGRPNNSGQQQNNNVGRPNNSGLQNNSRNEQNSRPFEQPRKQEFSQPKNETPAYQKPREQQSLPRNESRNNWFNQQQQPRQQTQPRQEQPRQQTQPRQEQPRIQAPQQRSQSTPAPAPRNENKNNGGGRPKR